MSGPAAVPSWETMAVWAEPDECACEWQDGTYFPCLMHMTPHSEHRVPAPGCQACQREER